MLISSVSTTDFGGAFNSTRKTNHCWFSVGLSYLSSGGGISTSLNLRIVTESGRATWGILATQRDSIEGGDCFCCGCPSTAGDGIKENIPAVMSTILCFM